MKKALSFLLAAALSVSMLTGCAGKNEVETTKTKNKNLNLSWQLHWLLQHKGKGCAS